MMDLQSFSECFRPRPVRRAALSRSVNHQERSANLGVRAMRLYPARQVAHTGFRTKRAPVFDLGIQLGFGSERHVFALSAGG
jgi:hypothetical protein